MKRMLQREKAAAVLRQEATATRLRTLSAQETDDVLEALGTTAGGLTPSRVQAARAEHGSNIVTQGKREPLLRRVWTAFVNPFTAILLALALVSVFTDIVLVAPGEKSYATVLIIATMVMLSGLLRFVQETRSGNAAAKLSKMIRTTACVERSPEGTREIPLEEVAVGDLVFLSAGDMIPADLRILTAKDLFVSQSALTGESEPVEKQGGPYSGAAPLTDRPNLAFLGSNVISGSAKAVVAAVGNDTILGSLAGELSAKPPKTSFETGINAVSWVLIRLMLFMVPVVLLLNGFTKGDWLSALLFAISIAVGLTPEMLPMLVTTGLVKGAVAMSGKRVIIKNLNAIQDLGAMDLLCTDKTGTLTQDKVVLEYYLNIHGQEDPRILRHAFLNSYFQTGLKNLIDLAIIADQDKLRGEDLKTAYTKVDEIPFDFNRRRMSVVVADQRGKTQLITKGAVEEMLRCCAFAELDGAVVPLTEAVCAFVTRKAEELNARGMRVIAVAHKTDPAPVGQFSVADEKNMVLLGFLAFLDPPKESAAAAISALRAHGVSVKILTGDNETVSRSICSQVGLPANQLLLGADVDAMTDGQLAQKAERIAVFAKLSPAQKARVVKVLRQAGHCVGYRGDGINDSPAMKAADVGISVDTAVDIAKESADVILLEKDLTVLEAGVVEGRKTYANMMKYIKMTVSSNFGNMFSVLAASAFLPFLPMAAIHLILLNLIYDLSCGAIPWDHVDSEFLEKPRKWDASSISRFMLWIGPTSSVFDITTYLLLYFVICPLTAGGQLYHQLTDPAARTLYIAVFQAGWFVESMWTQTLVIHMIRTLKLPFLQSRASAPVTLLTLAGIGAVTAIPFTPLGAALGFARLPAVYFAWLALTVAGYMLLATVVKKRYVRRYGELL